MTFGTKMPEPPFKHILAIVDGTDTSRAAVELAARLAASSKARITAVAFVETDTLKQLLSAKLLSEVEMADFEAGLGESGRRQLDNAAALAAKAGVKIETALIRGNSEEKVPQVVAERGADLIVIGAFETRRAMRDLLARQRMQIVDHAPCPVLVAR